MKGNRYNELDSIRGLAAASVMLSHILSVTPILFVTLLQHTPIHIVWAGHEAVILFFILSGFVLSLPFYNNNNQKYKDYLIKRICRIYIPYIVSVMFALLLITLMPRINAPNLIGWFNGVTPSITVKKIIEHILFLGYFQSGSYNFVIWSLVHEMRISIIFPLVMCFVLRFKWKKLIFLGFINSIFCLTLWYTGLKFFSFNLTKYDTSYLLTLHYISFFIIGALIAKYRENIHAIYIQLSNNFKAAIFVVGVLAYTYTWWFFHGIFFFHFQYMDDWIIALGCSIFIIFTLNSVKIKHIMLLQPINYIGKISYSLYLFHAITLVSLVNVFYNKIPIAVILVCSFIISILISSLTYNLVEKPSIRLGRYLARKKIINHHNTITKHSSI